MYTSMLAEKPYRYDATLYMDMGQKRKCWCFSRFLLYLHGSCPWLCAAHAASGALALFSSFSIFYFA